MVSLATKIPDSTSTSPMLSPHEAELVLQRAAKTAQENQRRGRTESNPMSQAELTARRTDAQVVQDELDRLKSERAIMALMEAANLPAKFSGIELGDVSRVPDDAKVAYSEACAKLATVLDTPGIMALIGVCGPGKTSMACGLIRECCRTKRSARFIDAMDYFVAVKETFGSNARLNQSQVELAHVKPFLLVIDELQDRGDTPWEDRMLTRLINKRYGAKLATVLISNQDRQSFAARVGASIVDRIRDGGGVIECTWKSLRGRL